MRQRTEDEIIRQAPIEATFGTTKYDIAPLKVFPQRAWRVKLETDLSEVVAQFNPSSQNTEAMRAGLTGALLQLPEKIVDLVFAYSPGLAEKREAILADATEEQFATVFSSIMQVAYPFLTQLGQVTAVVRAKAKTAVSRLQ